MLRKWMSPAANHMTIFVPDGHAGHVHMIMVLPELSALPPQSYTEPFADELSLKRGKPVGSFKMHTNRNRHMEIEFREHMMAIMRETSLGSEEHEIFGLPWIIR